MKPIEAYIRYIKYIRGYSQNTIKAYETDLRNFASWQQQHTPEARWSTTTRADIDAYIEDMSKQGAKPSTTNRQLASISGIYCFFQREGLDIDNPVRYESRRKNPDTIPNTIPAEDLRKAYRNTAGVAKYMVGMFMTTGIRLQELLDITWEDIDFDNNSIKIHGKGSKERTVYTTADVLERLAEYRYEKTATGRVLRFCQRKAREIIYTTLRPFTRAKQVSPHAIRHTYATEMAKAGHNATTIAKALGHKRIDTTQKYINMAEIEASQRSFANLIKKAS